MLRILRGFLQPTLDLGILHFETIEVSLELGDLFLLNQSPVDSNTPSELLMVGSCTFESGESPPHLLACLSKVVDLDCTVFNLFWTSDLIALHALLPEVCTKFLLEFTQFVNAAEVFEDSF